MIDVVYIGAGPVGISSACALKALNPSLKIAVLDKRPVATRTHGLKVEKDSIRVISKMLKEALKSAENPEHKQRVEKLRNQFLAWKKQFVKTNDIEAKIAEIAKEMGIIVIRDAELAPELTAEKLPGLISPVGEADSEAKKALRSAKVIVGADGAHSEVRKAFMKDEKVHAQTLQYVVELKYQTDGSARPMNPAAAKMAAYEQGSLAFHGMNRRPQEAPKPATLHIFVDEDTVNLLRTPDPATGKPRGNAQAPWSLEALKAQSKTEPKLRRLYKTLKRNLKAAEKSGGTCKDEKIATLDLTIYRSAESVVQQNGKTILLTGDSNSGMVLQRGFNKGLKEAALAAQAINQHFKKPDESQKPFEKYQRRTRRIFASERRNALFKNFWINIANRIVKGVSKIFFIEHRKV
jgi:2-polyprenyl-6-methoxyphenol hydroxylase-like FAD-dependent oxidoreductase